MTTTDFPNVPCQVCEKPVTPGKSSSMWVNRREVYLIEREVAEWNAKNDPPRPDGRPNLINGGALMTFPEAAKWKVSHVACYPEDAPIYDLDFPRTYRELVDHVAHLMGKGWCEHTDLDAFLREAVSLRGRFAPVP